jgi:L-ribulokinase
MAIVAGVDFGTLSVRVSLVDSERGLLESAIAEYPLHRKREDPEYATQSHDDHMQALASATREALKKAGVSRDQVKAIALDTTGSSVIPVGKRPSAARRVLPVVRSSRQGRGGRDHRSGSPRWPGSDEWCGGVYSSEWGFSKLLHWLRHNPGETAGQFASAFEHCDMVAATLCGITDPRKVKRSICAMGHKWMWNAQLGGLPRRAFW